MVCDELWPLGPRLLRSDGVFQLGTDAVMLSAFASRGGVRTICDLGCGAGIIALLLLWELPAARALCVDIQAEAVSLAQNNAEQNGLTERLTAVQGDIRDYKAIAAAGAFDLVVSNPPYFPVGSGRSTGRDSLAIAREERTCTLADICQAAAYLTRWGGKFAMVHRPERLSEVCCSLSAAGLEPKRLRLVQNTAAAAPSLILVESRRGGSPGLTIEPALILTAPNGGDSDEIKHIYHR